MITQTRPGESDAPVLPQTERSPRERGLALSSLGLVLLAVLAFRGLARFASMVESVEADIGGVERFFFVASDSSPQLILPAFVWLLWNRRRRLRAALVTPGWAPLGLAALAASAVLVLWSDYVAQPPLLLLALAGILLGGGWLLGGAEAARTLLVPALFLQLAWPLPGVLVNQVVYPLQMWTAEASTLLLRLLGFSYEHAGDIVVANDRTFQVIETCSGLRAMITLTMAAFLYAELFGRSPRRLLQLLVLAPLIAFVLNAFRVLTIMLNPYSEIASVHTTQGLVAIVLGVLALAAADRLLDLIPSERSRANASTRIRRVPPGAIPLPGWRWAAVAGTLAAIALAQTPIEPWRASTESRVRLKSRVPAELGTWTMVDQREPDRQFLGTARFSDSMRRVYQRDGQTVTVMAFEDNRIHSLLSLDSPKTAIGEAGLGVVEREGWRGELDGITGGELLVLRSLRGEQQLVLHWTEAMEPFPIELARSIFALDRSPDRRAGVARAVRLVTPIGAGPAAREQAEAKLREVASLLTPNLRQAD